MQKLRIEKPGCWGTIDGVFQQLPVGHEFIAASVPPAFAGRASVVGEVGEQQLEVSTPGGKNPEQSEQSEQADVTAKTKKAK
ncbi:hypothetical protein [Enterobacter asburiae]|uniref:hypothetical protein n=1 Tax=Enterobacter asburiae TaxID=61645 RepID=UPI001FF47489|nr:hypothetical protein [Enterobacter asburiae]MCL8163067.1 hypothetical protein [Enterobacter asburiae]MCM7942081.1 hypothetical protein [Enterobacter asburiae]MDV2291166.1 hypothetical protein [Enterobacter asburiae]UOY54767.1 hypothetical protein LCD48_15055 [Enterobacter asburiae]